MGRKVKVTTKCGETFYYDHTQEVDTVEIVESKFTQVRQVGEGGWMIRANHGYYLEEAGEPYYHLFDSNGKDVAHIRHADIKGKPYLA